MQFASKRNLIWIGITIFFALGILMGVFLAAQGFDIHFTSHFDLLESVKEN